MPPTVAPGAPEPVKFQPPPPQDPVRSGFPLASLGVGNVVGSTCGAPPPRPPPPNPPCATSDVPTTARIAAVHTRSRAPVCRNALAAFLAVIRSLIALLTFQPSAHSPARA